jgi:hypothetical protein
MLTAETGVSVIPAGRVNCRELGPIFGLVGAKAEVF